MRCSARNGSTALFLPKHLISPSCKTRPTCRLAGLPVVASRLNRHIWRASGRTTYRPKCCASAISATCRTGPMHATRTRWPPRHCAITTSALTARRIRCELRSNPARTDAAHYAAPVHRIRRPADHPVHRAETDRRDFLVMDLGAVAAVDRIRHCAADRGGCAACGGAVMSTQKLHSDDELIA